MKKYTIPSFINDSINSYGEKIALTFLDEKGVSYAELGEKIKEISSLLSHLGIKAFDKVAIIGENSPNWGAAYLSVLNMSAVIVPILHDFHAEEVLSIIKHSQSKLVFVSEKQYNRLGKVLYESELQLIRIDDLKPIGDVNTSLTAENDLPVAFQEPSEEDIAAIIYTSGTTGSSKGVMLTHKNISWNVEKCITLQDIHKDDRFLSILPMSHTYENTIGFLLPLSRGACVYYLRKQPTPTVLVEALGKVKPTLFLTVPLIIEKIYRKQVLPKFNKSAITRTLFKFQPTRVLLNRMAGKKLLKVFGGSLKFFGVGGAKLDPVIEKHLIEAKFPYSVGYGLTETSPLIAGSIAGKTKWQSTGKALEGVSLRIDNPDPITGEGEIQAKGPNVMKGYYKNPEATALVFTEDGYFKTGDLGHFDKHGTLSLRGRIKNVILGRNGENIYPEEIESIINSIEGVEESLVIEKQGKLIAMVNINIKELEDKIVQLNERYIKVRQESQESIDELLSEIQEFVNLKVNKFSRLQMVLIQSVPFEKTPTNKIKRYLYL